MPWINGENSQMCNRKHVFTVHVAIFQGPAMLDVSHKGDAIQVEKIHPYLEDHPISKCLIAKVSKSPIPGVIPLANGLFMAYKWGDPKYLQVLG